METAVEYLYKNLLDNPISNEDVIYNINVFEKAKEIEKQQIIDAYGVKVNHSIEQGTTVYTRTFGEEYYNTTYKEKN